MGKKISAVFTFLLYLIAGGLCGFFGISFFEKYDPPIFILIYILFTFYLSMILQTMIHECGHMIFGLLSGYEFLSIRFFNFMWIKSDNKIQFKMNSVPNTLGQCLMSIDKYQEPFPFLLYHLGGVLHNIIFSLLLFLICFFINNPFLQSFCFSTGVFGITMALINAIPLDMGIDNDGKNVMNMIKYPTCQYACFQQLKIVEYMSKGYSLKDIDEQYFTLYKQNDLSLCLTISLFTISREIDLEHYQNAYEMTKDILEKTPSISEHLSYVLNSLVIYYLLLNDPTNDEIINIRDEKYLKMKKLLKRDLTTLKIEYAYALLHNRDTSLAQEILKQFEKVCLTHPYLGEIESEKRQINMIDHIYKKSL